MNLKSKGQGSKSNLINKESNRNNKIELN